MAVYWYDVCNDYSLELRATKPDEAELDEMDMQVIKDGIIYGTDLDDEGAIYFTSHIFYPDRTELW